MSATYNKEFLYILLSLVLLPQILIAQVVINEVQISPTGERFIELYNTDDSAVDLTGWFIQRKTAGGTTFSSLVSQTLFEGKSIEANGYFLISRNSSLDWDILADGLTLTESNTLLLKNAPGAAGEVDKVGWGDASDCQSPCPPNPPSDHSIQRTSSGWIVASPTPRAANSSDASSTSTTTSSTTTSSSSASSAHYSAVPITTAPAAPKLSLGAGRDRIGMVGSPLEFKVEGSAVHGSRNIFRWNFGDGTVKGGTLLSHVYEYPGEYVVVLHASLPEGEAVARVNVRIVDAGFEVTHASPDRVEIRNNSKYEANLFGWILMSGERAFVFPRDTIIKAGQSISYGQKVTGLSPAWTGEVNLLALGERFDQSHVATKINEYRTAKATEIRNAIALLEYEVNQIHTRALATASEEESVESSDEQDQEVEERAVVQVATASQAGKAGGWFSIIKQFFLRK
jgi:hypothetical protein